MLYRALDAINYLEAKTLSEASEMCFSCNGTACLLAGGCSLIPLMKHGVLKPQLLVDITKIDGLRYIEGSLGEGLKIGALATLRDAEKSLVVQKDFPSLFDSITQIASVQVKNMGTIVGNITEGTPASDVAAMLIALGAKLKITSPGGTQMVPLDSFYVHVRKTILRPGDVIEEIIIPPRSEGTYSAFLNLCKTKEDPAKVNVGMFVRIAEGVCAEARIAVGAVAPVIVRARKAEDMLLGKTITSALIDEVAAAVREDEGVRPITDIRSTAEYRQEMVGVLTRRALTIIQQKAVH
jgi:CO/xanthine dehydrogenase FAD-binding subunit